MNDVLITRAFKSLADETNPEQGGWPLLEPEPPLPS